MKTVTPTWNSVVRFLFTVAWSLGVLIAVAVLLTILSQDYRFVAIGAVLLVPTVVAALAGGGIRSSQLGYADGVIAFRQRVRNRRPLWVMVGSVFGLLAIVTAIVAIWFRFNDLGLTSLWLVSLAIWSFGMCVTWDD